MEEDLFIAPEDRAEINLHNMQELEASYYLEKFLDTLPENIKLVSVIHGYKKGQVLLNMVRRNFKHNRIKNKVIPYNKGITLFYLK